MKDKNEMVFVDHINDLFFSYVEYEYLLKKETIFNNYCDNSTIL